MRPTRLILLPNTQQMTGLDDYIARMQDKQPGIYYVTGESKRAVENSPFLERLKKKGYEVRALP